MNYRHAFHAGNFGDVLKHAVLALVIEHMKKKPAPFRVVDTHAGRGLYDLASEEAGRTGEWRDGIGRLFGREMPPAIAALLAPYLGVVAAENPGGALTRYPGSPLLARRLLRKGDTLVANELHPDDGAALAALFARDRQTKVLALDGWTAVKSLLPPKERRGVVLIDPAFEEPGELRRLAEALGEGARRFASGTFLLWYPIKDEKAVARLHRELAALGLDKLYSAEVRVGPVRETGPLAGAGLVVLNPPFTLPDALAILLPFLAQRLGRGPGAATIFGWLADAKITSSRACQSPEK